MQKTTVKFIRDHKTDYKAGDIGFIDQYLLGEDYIPIVFVVNETNRKIVSTTLSALEWLTYSEYTEYKNKTDKTPKFVDEKETVLFEKAVYIDVETTGLDPVKNGIHQLSGIVEVNGEVVDFFNFRVAPRENEEISEEALKVAGVTKEQIMQGGNPDAVLAKFKNMLEQYVDKYDKTDKFHFIGYNASFDMNFVREFFRKGGDKYFGSWFYFPYVDVMQLAAFELREKRGELPNFKLTTVAREFGLEFNEEDAHDAMFDIELTKKLLEKLRR